jgi:two-component system response regulator WspF
MKVALVNDQPLALEALRRAIALRPEHQVAWLARNGAEAVECCARQRPDVVLMDLIMPVMDGVEATRRIMAETPCPILIVTSSVGANSWRVFEAMGHGALDAVDTPTFGAGAGGATALLEKISLVERGFGERAHAATRSGESGGLARTAGGTLVAIGASAGGPAALATVLGGLPKDFSAAIAVVQHVDAQFAPGMADWLNRTSPLAVRVARDGDALQPGAVLLAGTNDHLTLKDAHRVCYTSEPDDYVYRPSVDVFFHAVAQRWRGPVIGVLLTGMGRDGALGLKVLRNYGHRTLAQDQATSAVYGMPKAAAQLDAADEILSLSAIAPRLIELVSKPT